MSYGGEPETTGRKQDETLPAKRNGWELDGMNADQRAEACAIQERVLGRPKRPRVQIEHHENAPTTLLVGHGSDADKTLHSMRLFEAVGSASNGYVDDFLRRLSDAVRLSGDNARDSQIMSGAIALVAAVDPKNELEATMALQMVAANEAALMCFSRSRAAEFIEHASAYSSMGNKAMRSFALHAEAIAKLRRGGEQVVKHVHVGDGGQAVIAGTVNTGGRG